LTPLQISPEHHLASRDDAVKPTLVLSFDAATLSGNSIIEQIELLDETDDVFGADFLSETLVLQSSPIPDLDLMDQL
jgi:hypothetical protein